MFKLKNMQVELFTNFKTDQLYCNLMNFQNIYNEFLYTRNTILRFLNQSLLSFSFVKTTIYNSKLYKKLL